MKKIAALFALIAVLAIAGCSNDNKKADGTSQNGETTTTGNKVTEMAVTMPTQERLSEDALEIISQNLPLYRKYLEKRMSIPLVLECKITSPEGTILRNLYIKADESVSTYAKNLDSTESTTIISLDGYYFLDHAEKKAYKFNYNEDVIKSQMDQFKFGVTMEDMKKITESTMQEEAEYNGAVYKTESVTDDSGLTTYYFDKSNDELRFIVNGNTVTEILKLEAADPDNKYYEVPADYEVIDFFEYAASVSAEEAKTAESAESSAQ